MRAGLRQSSAQFYDAYWSREVKSVPEGDRTTEARQRLVAMALDKFLAGSSSDEHKGRVLDAGCGDGEFTAFIKNLGFDVIGMDIAGAAIERATMLCPDTCFYVGSLEERLPFHDGEFDATWSTEVLEHLFDIHASLSEFNRVLREGGILILTTPFHGAVKNLAIALVAFERHFNPYLSHIRFFTKKSLTKCLTRAGFEPMMWRGIGRVWPLYKSFFVVARKVRAAGPAPEIIG